MGTTGLGNYSMGISDATESPMRRAQTPTTRAGESAFLMTFEIDEATVYQIRSRHRNEEVRDLIPSDNGGGQGPEL